ncbi:uncharacterized protein LOC123554994 [Mercenaria mercenaria]|uniref:uncharacterized protein LOC123554994 n=1 Tax=Mercenaria mercenaria TaxID=6596 RepID=UPI00234E82DF|nr:uncharacterized protein LOC123554994 [Mercenaria mercenaria]
MDPTMCIRAFVLCVLMPGALGSDSLSYDCTSNNEVHISGFPPNSYYYAMQNSTQCNVTSTGAQSITISGCAKDSEILLTYGSYSGMEAYSLHGGKYVVAVKVTCNEIPLTGNVHNVSEIFSANLTIGETQSVDPSYNITSALSSYYVTVGDQIIWTISFPVQYTLEVTECTASPGTSYDAVDKVDLISIGGCHVSTELISNFTDNGNGTASAIIDAFKFYSNDQVFLTCDLKVCPSGSTQCDTQCAGSRKREVGDIFKRSAPGPDIEGFYPRNVHNVLTVLIPNENSAITVTPVGWTFVLTLIFVLCNRLSSAF